MDGDDGMRIYHEVLKGITESPDADEKQRAYRSLVAKQVADIRAQDGAPEPRKELP